MMKKLLDIEVFLAIILAVATVGLIYPYGFPLLSIIVGVYIIIYFMTKRIKVELNIGIILFYLLIILYLKGLLFFGVYSVNISDLINCFIILLLFLISGNLKKGYLLEINKIYFNLLSVIVPILSIFSIYKYIMYLNGVQFQFLSIEGRPYPIGTSFMPDYNMFSLGLSIGVIATLIKFKQASKFTTKVYYFLGSSAIIFAILFSGSRRGWIILIFIATFMAYNVLKVILKSSWGMKVNLGIFVTILITMILLNYNRIKNFLYNNEEFLKLKYRFETLNSLEGSFETRSTRIDHTIHLIKDFDFLQIFIGKGFDYLPYLGSIFKTTTGLDYPHNIFLSTFYYSGLIGLFILLLLLCLPLLKIIKYKNKAYNEWIIIYLIIISFLIISGNSFFSISILPLCLFIIVCKKNPIFE